MYLWPKTFRDFLRVAYLLLDITLHHQILPLPAVSTRSRTHDTVTVHHGDHARIPPAVLGPSLGLGAATGPGRRESVAWTPRPGDLSGIGRSSVEGSLCKAAEVVKGDDAVPHFPFKKQKR